MFLQDNEETFSDFITILHRGNQLGLMKAYGTYTCFAPTNEAVERFLFEQDSIWRASLGTEKEVWTGVTSPRLEELSDSMCGVIARTHIIPYTVLSMEMESDVLPYMNLNKRYLTVAYSTDERLHATLEVNGSLILVPDQEVTNGVVHTMDAVLNPSSNTVPKAIADTPFLSIFSKALEVTELDERMQQYIDYDYKPLRSTDLETRRFGYTAFCEPDEVFHEHDIYSVEDLYARCKEWYPAATDEDFTSENNALWQFMAYHLMNRKLLYTRAVCYDINVWIAGNKCYASEVNFQQNSDRVEYYETFQGPLVKMSRPLSNNMGGEDAFGLYNTFRNLLLLNYTKKIVNRSDPFHTTCGEKDIPINIQVLNPINVKIEKERFPGYSQEALNGSILLIDNLLIYDENVMAGYVLNETIREDIIGLIPELTNNNVRWSGECYAQEIGRDGLSMPDGYSDVVKFYSDETSLNITSCSHSFQRFQGDFICVYNNPDLAFRLPHVPAGTYEIRLCYPTWKDFGVVQCYVDDQITGIPVDMAMFCDHPLIGYAYDEDTEDNGIANDKEMKNRGYLKGPTCYTVSPGSTLARDHIWVKRQVLTTKYLAPGDHWVRLKGLSENSGLIFDYFELVPVGWLRNEGIPLEEKRW